MMWRVFATWVFNSSKFQLTGFSCRDQGSPQSRHPRASLRWPLKNVHRLVQYPHGPETTPKTSLQNNDDHSCSAKVEALSRTITDKRCLYFSCAGETPQKKQAYVTSLWSLHSFSLTTFVRRRRPSIESDEETSPLGDWTRGLLCGLPT